MILNKPVLIAQYSRKPNTIELTFDSFLPSKPGNPAYCSAGVQDLFWSSAQDAKAESLELSREFPNKTFVVLSYEIAYRQGTPAYINSPDQ